MVDSFQKNAFQDITNKAGSGNRTRNHLGFRKGPGALPLSYPGICPDSHSAFGADAAHAVRLERYEGRTSLWFLLASSRNYNNRFWPFWISVLDVAK